MKLAELVLEKKEKASDASARYEKFKAMLDAGSPGVTAAQVNGIKKIADDLWDQELKAREKHLVDTHGAEWYELVKKQYPIEKIDDDWVVKSKIRDWTDEKEWAFGYKAQAVEKVEKLVKWLAQGRKRGFGDKDADIQKWLDKLAEVDVAS